MWWIIQFIYKSFPFQDPVLFADFLTFPTFALQVRCDHWARSGLHSSRDTNENPNTKKSHKSLCLTKGCCLHWPADLCVYILLLTLTSCAVRCSSARPSSCYLMSSVLQPVGQGSAPGQPSCPLRTTLHWPFHHPRDTPASWVSTATASQRVYLSATLLGMLSCHTCT